MYLFPSSQDISNMNNNFIGLISFGKRKTSSSNDDGKKSNLNLFLSAKLSLRVSFPLWNFILLKHKNFGFISCFEWTERNFCRIIKFYYFAMLSIFRSRPFFFEMSLSQFVEWIEKVGRTQRRNFDVVGRWLELKLNIYES